MFHHVENLLLSRRISSINALFANNALRSLAISLFGIFQPIYIFSLTKSIEAVLLYTLVVRLGCLFMVFPAGRLIVRFGFRRNVLLSNFFLSGLLIFLLLSGQSVWFLIPAAIFDIPALLLYWLPLHILIIDDSEKGKLGGEISFLNIISHIFHILPPFVGGIVITLLGFRSLYLLAIALAILSSIPLFFMPHHKKPRTLEYGRYLRIFSFPKFSFILHGFEDFFIGTLWPILMFLVLMSYEKVGSITSLTLFFTTISLVLIGYFLDRGKVLSFYKVGTLLSLLLFPFRAFVSTVGGVLFIDEIANLKPESQQELLTAIQEKKYPITGQSERSAGAMVRTEAVPCDFILVAAGNFETIKNMHPALRSRIRGYGYEVYMNDTMRDTKENRLKIARFVAQEVKKEDGKIPHFSKEAVMSIIQEARRMASRKGHLTIRLRELGGLIRAAGIKDKDLIAVGPPLYRI